MFSNTLMFWKMFVIWNERASPMWLMARGERPEIC